MTPPAISVVIVAWNSGAALEPCIGALRRSAEGASCPIEVIVVDNGSVDSSVARAEELGVDCLVSNPVNAGYGVAASQGMARARASWSLLVNPDVVVEESFVEALTSAARTVPEDVAMLVPDLRFAFDRTIVNCRGIEVDDSGIPAEVESATRATDVDEPRGVFAGSTAACLYRVDAVRSVGGIELAFFAYMEDVDLAWRLRRSGRRALFIPSAVALHEGSASVGADSPVKTFLVARNRRLLFRLNASTTVQARARRTIVEAGHTAVMTASGSRFAPVAGRLDALRLRTYTRYVRMSRALIPATTEPAAAERVSLAQSLMRKRANREAMVAESR